MSSLEHKLVEQIKDVANSKDYTDEQFRIIFQSVLRKIEDPDVDVTHEDGLVSMIISGIWMAINSY